MAKKTRSARRREVGGEKKMTRRDVVVKENVNLSTSDLSNRVTHLRSQEERANGDIDRLSKELSTAKRTARTVREDGDTVQSLIDARK